LGLAIWRVARCNPFSSGGIDYPPAGRGRRALLYDVVTLRQNDGVIHQGDLTGAAPTLNQLEAFERQAVQSEGPAS